jgi:hypothetical protein
VAIRKGLSLTDYCSGATRQSGRFSEGLLLRRSQAVSSRSRIAILAAFSFAAIDICVQTTSPESGFTQLLR